MIVFFEPLPFNVILDLRESIVSTSLYTPGLMEIIILFALPSGTASKAACMVEYLEDPSLATTHFVLEQEQHKEMQMNK